MDGAHGHIFLRIEHVDDAVLREGVAVDLRAFAEVIAVENLIELEIHVAAVLVADHLAHQREGIAVPCLIFGGDAGEQLLVAAVPCVDALSVIVGGIVAEAHAGA